MGTAFVSAIQLLPPDDGAERSGYPWNLPAVAALSAPLRLDPGVTYLVGENGSGKSTLLEAIAVAAGMNPEGGSSNFAFSTRDSHSGLWETIRLIRGAQRPKTDFFLRAESLFTAATYLDEMKKEEARAPFGLKAFESYGGRSLHEQSHGESFLAVMINRFGPHGFYLLDEPEAALSTQNCLTCLRRIHELVAQGSQFIIATHSPLILAYPESTIYVCTERTRANGLRGSRARPPHAQLPGLEGAIPPAAVRRLGRGLPKHAATARPPDPARRRRRSSARFARPRVLAISKDNTCRNARLTRVRKRV